MGTLQFGVLGPVTAWCDQVEVGPRAAKHRRVLAALLLYADRQVDRDRIIDVVWGTNPPKSAVNLVQKYVGELRRALDPDRQDGLLTSVGSGYRLRVTPERVDSGIFAGRVDAARTARANGELDTARQGLAEALRLWRGPAFSGIDAELVVAERARLEESRLSAVEDLAEIDLLLGDNTSVVTELSRLTGEHPLRERLRELWMLALYRDGRQAEALTVYDGTRRLLADELGLDPGPALRALHERILRGDPALDSGGGPASASAPEPDPCTDPAPPVHQLPRDVPDFTGRVAPRDELLGMLSDNGGPPAVSVIVGAPGVGKSTLAVHAAHAASGDFPDGQLYLRLAGTSDTPRTPAAMLAELLRAISPRGAAIPDDLDERAGLYRSLMAGRRMLILLDDAAAADQVRPLLPGAAGCAVLVTSRFRLADLAGARHLDLGVFRLDEARQLLTRVVGRDRIGAEPEQAAALVRACGYLPLAIRIAGSRLASRPGWSLAVLNDRLADESHRIDELRVGAVGVYASFDLSLRLLPQETARAFRLLGLLGAQTLPGWIIGPLLDRPRADRVLDELVDASLVELVGTDATGQPRYRLHDLLRDYAVRAGEADPVELRRSAIARVLGAWLHLAEAAKDGLPTSIFRPGRGNATRWPLAPDTRRRLLEDALAWFDTERGPLLGAVALATNWGLPELAWELAAAVVPYYDHRSHYDDWQLSHTVALPAVASAGDRRGEAALLRGLGQVHIYRDAIEDARWALRRSRQLSGEIGDERGAAIAVAGLASVERVAGRYEEALALATEALDTMVAIGERHAEAQLRSGIGVIRLALGSAEEAVPWFEDALRLACELGDAHREATILRRLSGLHQQRGDLARALLNLRRSLTIFERIEDERCAAYTLLRMGRVRAESGDTALAISVVERALSVFRRLNNSSETAECSCLLGELHARYSDTDAARGYLLSALRLWQSLGATEQAAATWQTLRNLDPAANVDPESDHAS